MDLLLRWKGGAITELSVPLKRKPPQRLRTGEDTIDLLRRLAAHYPDATIAGILNRQHRRTARGLPFTASRVQSLRHHHKIPCHQPGDHPQDGELLTVADTAHQLGLAPSTLHRWLSEGFIAGEQLTPGAPWRIRLTADIRALFVDDAPDGWLAMLEATLAYGVSRQTLMQRVKRGEPTWTAAHRSPRSGPSGWPVPSSALSPSTSSTCADVPRASEASPTPDATRVRMPAVVSLGIRPGVVVLLPTCWRAGSVVTVLDRGRSGRIARLSHGSWWLAEGLTVAGVAVSRAFAADPQRSSATCRSVACRSLRTAHEAHGVPPLQPVEREIGDLDDEVGHGCRQCAALSTGAPGACRASRGRPARARCVPCRRASWRPFVGGPAVTGHRGIRSGPVLGRGARSPRSPGTPRTRRRRARRSCARTGRASRSPR